MQSDIARDESFTDSECNTSLSVLTVVMPRSKKPLADGSPPAQPVLITPQLVAALTHLPLCQAAAAAGVSPTTFKKACRKLGLRRWAYKRRYPSASAGAKARAAKAAPSSAAPAADGAYLAEDVGGDSCASFDTETGDEDGPLPPPPRAKRFRLQKGARPRRA